MEFNQSIKSIMDIEVSSMYTPTPQSKKICMDCCAFSKTLLFLPIHSVQKRHKGTTLRAFFCFFPTKQPLVCYMWLSLLLACSSISLLSNLEMKAPSKF